MPLTSKILSNNLLFIIFIQLISKRYDLVFQEKNYEEDNIRDQIIALAESLTINYIFLGYSGRKGKKMDPSLLGQTVKNSLYRTAIPLIVVKHLYKRTEKASKGFNFLVCIDGSDKSYKALEACLTLSKSENDEIYAVTASSLQGEYHTETIKVKFDEIAEKNKEKKLSFVILKPSHDPANAIIEYVNFNEKVDFDFVVLGNNGIRAQIEGKAFLGRMAERILANIKANPIIIP